MTCQHRVLTENACRAGYPIHGTCLDKPAEKVASRRWPTKTPVSRYETSHLEQRIAKGRVKLDPAEDDCAGERPKSALRRPNPLIAFRKPEKRSTPFSNVIEEATEGDRID